MNSEQIDASRPVATTSEVVSAAPRPAQHQLFKLITAGVAIWGLVHAIGAYTLNHNPWRAVVVLACVGAYLGFWWLMLMSRSRGQHQAGQDLGANSHRSR